MKCFSNSYWNSFKNFSSVCSKNSSEILLWLYTDETFFRYAFWEWTIHMENYASHFEKLIFRCYSLDNISATFFQRLLCIECSATLVYVVSRKSTNAFNKIYGKFSIFYKIQQIFFQKILQGFMNFFFLQILLHIVSVISLRISLETHPWISSKNPPRILWNSVWTFFLEYPFNNLL